MKTSATVIGPNRGGLYSKSSGAVDSAGRVAPTAMAFALPPARPFMKPPRDRQSRRLPLAAPGAEGLTLFELSKSYGGRAALDAVSLRVARGEVVALFGPNGAGKTTLLRAAAGLLAPSGGRVLVDGVDLALQPAAAKRKLGWAGDTPLFYDGLTALENLVFFARLWGVPPAEAEPAARRALEAAGLAHRGADSARELSHGMRQRLAIARATLHAPSVLLLDEPFEGLDASAAASLVASLREGAARAGRACLVASHQTDLALESCDRVVILHRGKLVRVAPRGETTVPGLTAELRALGGEALGA
jgi:ABC-type multidrug transport system ATPase subunit